MTQAAALPETGGARPSPLRASNPLTRLLGDLRGRMFGTRRDALLSLAVLAILGSIASAILPWALVNATWTGASRADCTGGGACWAFVASKAPQFIYGFYPPLERWRPDIAFSLLLVGLVWLMVPRIPGKAYAIAFIALVLPITTFLLLRGGFAGLPLVPSDQWGGFMLTMILAVSGITFSLPFGVVFALGRQSKLPLIRWFCVGFIELCRGVPFLTVLFMAIVMLPFFLPPGTKPDPLALAVGGIIFYEAAYMAEVVRGGLQAVPKGQYEAAMAIGFGYWRTMLHIILPQAVRKVVPGVVNTTISLLKNTTLVMVVGLFDLLNIVSAGVSDPLWAGSQAEGYFIVGLVFWLMSFGLSCYSRAIEAGFARADRS
ncbi:MAG TPA: amino acid ABC transporter permease [Bosea sp. (in: a-proteobacteria)]|uniref:amino acid ABC transporter permease n=1 Tax=Bosea sp. (in: a-proteobacteria) TaxID=1871050 RepID=UPI002E0FF001|nr:amino acid ABC transporter permease [Bosea sp. (in: a-proteobacteria)]